MLGRRRFLGLGTAAAHLDGGGAAACLACAHRACRDACPFGLAIPALTRDAARRLA